MSESPTFFFDESLTYGIRFTKTPVVSVMAVAFSEAPAQDAVDYEPVASRVLWRATPEMSAEAANRMAFLVGSFARAVFEFLSAGGPPSMAQSVVALLSAAPGALPAGMEEQEPMKLSIFDNVP